MIERFKKWRYQKRFERARAALNFLVNKKDAQIYGEIKAICDILAEKKAKAWCMKWLDSRRTAHCFDCPTTGPLQKLNEKYYCALDFAKAKKKSEAPELAVV